MKAQYFNAHLEGMGYLNNIKEVPSANGSFWAVTFCMLEGNPENPDKLYVSTTISSKSALEVLQKHAADINNQDVKVYGNFRLARFRAEPFVYKSGEKQGSLGVNYNARLIKIGFLKVGERVVVESTETSDSQAQPKQNNAYQTGAEPLNWTTPVLPKDAIKDENVFDSPYRLHPDRDEWVLPMVKLEAEDPQLQRKRTALKQHGYYMLDQFGLDWRMTAGPKPQPSKSAPAAQKQQSHQKPFQVELTKDDAQFDAKKQALIADGYRYHSGALWLLKEVYTTSETFGKALANAGYRTDDGKLWKATFPVRKRRATA